MLVREGTGRTFGLDSFIIPHVPERLERVLRHMQLHVTSQRPLGCGYENKAMPEAHIFKENHGPGVSLSAVQPAPASAEIRSHLTATVELHAKLKAAPMNSQLGVGIGVAAAAAAAAAAA
jgi:hypothetical protein